MTLSKLSLNLVRFSVLFFSFFPLLPNRIKGFPVILLFISTLLFYLFNKKRKFPFKQTLIFSSIYFILLLSLVNTENFLNIDKLLSTGLSLFVIPISFGFINSADKSSLISQNLFMYFITLLNFFTTIFSIYVLYILINLGVFNQEMSLPDAIAYITNEMWFISQHPIYASIFISISIFLMVFLWLTNSKRTYFLVSLPFVMIQVLTLFILDRKGVLLSFIVSLSILVFTLLKKKHFNIKSKFTVVLIFISILFFTLNSKRFQELYKKDNYSDVLKFNSTNLRYNIYACAFQKVIESPFLGYGLGDVQLELNKCYKKRSPLLTEIIYNSHNQYLSYYLSSGIIGLMLLVYVIFKLFKQSFSKKNVLLLSITLFFSIIFFFENLLERQSGVILFTFYSYFFYYFNFSNKGSYEFKI